MFILKIIKKISKYTAFKIKVMSRIRTNRIQYRYIYKKNWIILNVVYPKLLLCYIYFIISLIFHSVLCSIVLGRLVSLYVFRCRRLLSCETTIIPTSTANQWCEQYCVPVQNSKSASEPIVPQVVAQGAVEVTDNSKSRASMKEREHCH